MAQQRVYAVLMHVAEPRLATVLSALTGAAVLVSVTPTEEIAEDQGGRRGFRDGKRDKGISGRDLLLETMAKEDRVYTLTELGNAFSQRGFTATSASPVLSTLAKEGKVRALGAGKFCLPGHLMRQGAAHGRG